MRDPGELRCFCNASGNLRAIGSDMRKLIIPGIVVIMAMWLAVAADAYAVSVAVTGSDGTDVNQIDFGDWGPLSYDRPAQLPVSGSYLAAAAFVSSVYLDISLDSAHISATPWDFYVWNVGGYTSTPAKLRIFLEDDGAPATGWGGTRVTLNNWYVTDVTAGTTYGPFTFPGLANTTYDINDPNGIWTSAGIPVPSLTGTGITGAEHLQIYQCSLSVAAAKQLPAGTEAGVQNAIVTATTVDSTGVFVESADRSSGIKLITSQALAVGQIVSFTGVTGRVGGEYQISNVTFVNSAAGVPLTPLGMTTKTIGNDMTESLKYSGINTTGLLVRFAGTVTAVMSSQRVVYVDDGFGYADGIGGSTGIRVQLPSGVSLPSQNHLVTVTGISRVVPVTLTGAATVNGVSYPAGTVLYVPGVWVRNTNDIKTIH